MYLGKCYIIITVNSFNPFLYMYAFPSVFLFVIFSCLSFRFDVHFIKMLEKYVVFITYDYKSLTNEMPNQYLSNPVFIAQFLLLCWLLKQ